MIKKITVLFSILIIGSGLITCSSPTNNESSCRIDCPAGSRKGATCKDGTTSTSTGSGTCSGHGGVECWQCAE